MEETGGNGNQFLLPTTLFFVLVAGYFFLFGDYVLFVQEQQSLFVFSGETLREALSKPGGPLAYLGDFLTQFYASKLLASLILATVLTLPAIFLFVIHQRTFSRRHAPWGLFLLPSALLFAMQANHYHGMEVNLGILVTLAVYLLAASFLRTGRRTLALILIPLFFYLAGGFALAFTGLCLTHIILQERGTPRYVGASLLLVTAGATLFLFWRFLFLQPFLQVLLFPLPSLENPAYATALVLLFASIVLLPAMGRLVPDSRKLFPDSRKLFPDSRKMGRIFAMAPLVLVVALSGWVAYKQYDARVAGTVELQRLVFQEEWDQAIETYEMTPSRTLMGQFLYNTALSETDQLLDRVFFGFQDFGPDALVLPYTVENLSQGALFYFSIGLMNEAHRWAYEDMVTFGNRPQNLKILAETSLLNGDHEMARRYANILQKTTFYSDWAEDVLEMADDPDLIRSDPRLAAKLEILPKSNFFVEYNYPPNTLIRLLEAQPDNRKAVEYLLAGFLLGKNIEGAVSSIPGMAEAGYTRIPRHLEEAALMLLGDVEVDLGGLSVSEETRARFQEYTNAVGLARRSPSTYRDRMQADFGNTYWFYYQFR